ncbi:MAG TPA: hypothetical protein VGN00_09395 [Puia sp.]
MLTNELFQTLTHHFVDDLTGYEEAIESFRRHFPLPGHRAILSADGRKLTYATALAQARYIAGQANEVIEALCLPLMAIITDNQLVVIYTGK